MENNIIMKVVESSSKEHFEEELNRLVVLYDNLNYNIDVQYNIIRIPDTRTSSLKDNWYSALIIARRDKNAKEK